MIRTAFRSSLALLVLAALLVPTALMAEAPGTLEFKAHNAMYKAHGKFQTWEFTQVTIPEGDFTQAEITLEVDLASVWEKAEKLAAHLRNADFFEVETYAKSTIKIHSIESTGENTYKGTATVDLHGNTGDVPVEFTVDGKEVKGSAVLKRTDFGIGEEPKEGDDRSITDDVEIMLTATLP